MEHDSVDPTEVLAAWKPPFADWAVEPLGSAGGLSGARLWRVRAVDQSYCLRQWPREHPTRDGLAWIHALLDRAVQAGCAFVPQPLRTHDGQTMLGFRGRWWELTTWRPGAADFHQRPSVGRLQAALAALAELHRAWSESSGSVGPSPGMAERAQRLQREAEQGWLLAARAIDQRHGSAVAELCRQILQAAPERLMRAAPQLARACELRVPLQPCLRDIWHDHVLFTGDQVSGVIDFGAMRHENVASDLARLLGSLVRADAEGWRVGLAAYERRRPLSDAERELIATLAVINPLIAGLNWTTWLYLEDRVFPLERVQQRLTETAAQLGAC